MDFLFCLILATYNLGLEEAMDHMLCLPQTTRTEKYNGSFIAYHKQLILLRK